MVKQHDGVAVVYSLIIYIDVVIHQIATLLLLTTVSQLLINSNRCPVLYPLVKFMRLPGDAKKASCSILRSLLRIYC